MFKKNITRQNLIEILILPLIFVTILMVGIYSFVGYYGTVGGNYTNLPYLKKAVLSPLDGLNRTIDNNTLIEKINMLYAKDYKLINSNILLKIATRLLIVEKLNQIYNSS